MTGLKRGDLESEKDSPEEEEEFLDIAIERIAMCAALVCTEFIPASQ